MSTPTKTPPTEPGLYRWHDGKGNAEIRNVFAACGVLKYNVFGRETRYLATKGGYWERIELGEPYIAPEPPPVELWQGENENGETVQFAKCGFMFNYNFCSTNVKTRAELRLLGYTNLRKVGNLVLEEGTT